MKNIIVLFITALLLTGCGGGVAKFFSKFLFKFASKPTIVTTGKSTFADGFNIRIPPAALRCAAQKVQDKNCFQSNQTN